MQDHHNSCMIYEIIGIDLYLERERKRKGGRQREREEEEEKEKMVAARKQNCDLKTPLKRKPKIIGFH